MEIAIAERQKTLLDLENEQTSRRRFQDELIKLKNLTVLLHPLPIVAVWSLLMIVQRTQDAQSFILVLIDADADDYTVGPLACSVHQIFLRKANPLLGSSSFMRSFSTTEKMAAGKLQTRSRTKSLHISRMSTLIQKASKS